MRILIGTLLACVTTSCITVNRPPQPTQAGPPESVAPESTFRIPGPCLSELGSLAARTMNRRGLLNDACRSRRFAATLKYARYYSFTLDQAMQVRIEMRSSDVEPYLSVRGTRRRDPTAIVHADDDSGGVARAAAIDQRLPAGTYTIEATTFDVAATGPFTLRLTTTVLPLTVDDDPSGSPDSAIPGVTKTTPVPAQRASPPTAPSEAEKRPPLLRVPVGWRPADAIAESGSATEPDASRSIVAPDSQSDPASPNRAPTAQEPAYFLVTDGDLILRSGALNHMGVNNDFGNFEIRIRVRRYDSSISRALLRLKRRLVESRTETRTISQDTTMTEEERRTRVRASRKRTLDLIRQRAGLKRSLADSIAWTTPTATASLTVPLDERDFRTPMRVGDRIMVTVYELDPMTPDFLGRRRFEFTRRMVTDGVEISNGYVRSLRLRFEPETGLVQ